MRKNVKISVISQKNAVSLRLENTAAKRVIRNGDTPTLPRSSLWHDGEAE
jgi:hypothetical protein